MRSFLARHHHLLLHGTSRSGYEAYERGSFPAPGRKNSICRHKDSKEQQRRRRSFFTSRCDATCCIHERRFAYFSRAEALEPALFTIDLAQAGQRERRANKLGGGSMTCWRLLSHVGGRIMTIGMVGLSMLAVQVSTAQAAKVDREAAIARVSNAMMEAQINPEGHDTTCQVQYVDEEQFRLTEWSDSVSLPCSPEDLGSGSSEQTTTVELGGLQIAT